LFHRALATVEPASTSLQEGDACKRVVVLLSAAAFGVGAAAPVALAQDTVEATEEDDGTDYGWIGLLGLAGLAGLLGRKRDDRVDRDRGTVR
jgi:MYXO-CTERM domain-containing protein